MSFRGYGQGLKYDSSMDSIWFKNAYVPLISKNGDWVLINEYSDYRPDVYKVVNTKGEGGFNLGHCLSVQFSPDSKWVAFNSLDKNLKILNLNKQEYQTLGLSTKYEYNFTGEKLAYIQDSRLVILNLRNNKSIEFGEIKDFVWNPINDKLIAKKHHGDSTLLVKIKSDLKQEILYQCKKCDFTNIKWSMSGNQLVFIKNNNNKNELHYLELNGNHKFITDSLFNINFPNHLIGERYLSISEDGKKISFYREKFNYMPVEQENIEVWNTNDVWLYPRLKSYEIEQGHLKSLWEPSSGYLIAIENEDTPFSYFDLELSFALVFDKKKYEPQYEHYPYTDIYLLDLNSRKKKLIIEKLYSDPSYISISPNGNFICFFQENNWWLFNIATNKYINLTAGVSVDWTIKRQVRTKNSHVVETPFWSNDGNYILLHDQYDVWKFSTDAKISERLTKGREANISYQIYSHKNDKENLRKLVNGIGLSIDIEKPILLNTEAHNLNTGISILTTNKKVNHLFLKQIKTDNLYKLSDDAIIFSKSRFNKAPIFYRMNLSTKNELIFHEVNPQINIYDFGRYEVFNYETDNFENLNGVLVYPTQYNPSLQYPMIVWAYEKNSRAFYKYLAPSDRNDFNFYKYINNGYFILFADIEYEIGRAGFSALDCITSSVSEAIKLNPTINKNMIGLLGFSFGGYEAAFIATQTNLFKAVVAGAAATDLVSFYHDNWWEYNRPQAWRLESQQFRMGDTYYNMKENYWRNSPLYHVENMETPLLLWTGRHDTNINWYQSVFMFNAMKRLNKPGKLIIFNDEGHSLVKPNNQERLSKEIFDWFEFYLKKH